MSAQTDIDSQLMSTMKRKCKCPPGSPFHWHEDPRPSMFAKDPLFTAGAKLSQSQTQVVERERAKGRDIGNIAELSARLLNTRQFLIYSKP